MGAARTRKRIADIIENIGRIETFIQGMSRAAFEQDMKTALAVERCLLIISEAAVRLGDDEAALMPDVPWPDVRGMGNHLRHAYDRLDADTLWATIERDLRPLRAACEQALRDTDDQ